LLGLTVITIGESLILGQDKPYYRYQLEKKGEKRILIPPVLPKESILRD